MPAEGLKSRIYFGRVMHKRLRPFAHRFAYRVYAFLFDLDELDRLDRELPGFSHNRGNLFSLRDRDHGPRDGSPLKPWAEAVCARGGIDLEGGRVELLCLPRLLGYAFNPLSLWFCHDRAGTLRHRLGQRLDVAVTAVIEHQYLGHAGSSPCWMGRQAGLVSRNR